MPMFQNDDDLPMEETDKARPSYRLTVQQRHELINHILDRRTPDEVATIMQVSKSTVLTAWNKFLRDKKEERELSLEFALEEALARIDKIAADARRGALEAWAMKDLRLYQGFLETEKKALETWMKLGGYDVLKVESIVNERTKAATEKVNDLVGAFSRVVEASDLSEGERRAFRQRLSEEVRKLSEKK